MTTLRREGREGPAGQGRGLVDRGAIFAGWVGLGVAFVVAVSFALIIPIQALVFLCAPLAGLLVGWYAGARSERSRPWGRVLANAAYAGLVTGLCLALFYAGLRLLFVYADNGFPDYNRTDLQGQVVGASCQVGPGCTYQRYLDAGRGGELTALGVGDAAAFETYLLREQLNASLVLIASGLLGGVAGGVIYGLTAPRGRPEG